MDKEWCKGIEEQISSLKNRIDALECRDKNACAWPDAMKLDIILPKMDIEGLHFNKQEVHAVFELKSDGWYYSKDILFMSARDTDEGTERDLLSEYLADGRVETAFISAISNWIRPPESEENAHPWFEHDNIKVFIPEENQGIKKYNGVDWWYWLKGRYSGSAAIFCRVNNNGHAGIGSASAVGGCAPAFCVGDNRHE